MEGTTELLAKSVHMNPEAILEQLDEAARRYVFPMLDNGYVYPAGA